MKTVTKQMLEAFIFYFLHLYLLFVFYYRKF